MVQTAKPDADLLVGNWLDEDGGAAALFDGLDRNDELPVELFAESIRNPVGEVYVCSLELLTDPVTGGGHVLRLGAIRVPEAGRSVDLTVELRQGYVNEATQGTLIASIVFLNIANGTADDDEELLELILTTVEADSITDYADLAVRVVADEC